MDKHPFLSELEKTLVEAFYNNETQREAVRKVMLHGLNEQGVLRAGLKHDPKHNWALMYATRDDLTNEQLGADLRASAQGIMFVERAFADMSGVRVQQRAKERKNQGR